VFQLRHCHRSWVPRSSAVAFQFGSNDPFFKIANKKLAWLSSNILLNLSKFSRDCKSRVGLVTGGFAMISEKGFEKSGIS
jgi:hypothetical protein